MLTQGMDRSCIVASRVEVKNVNFAALFVSLQYRGKTGRLAAIYAMHKIIELWIYGILKTLSTAWKPLRMLYVLLR